MVYWTSHTNSTAQRYLIDGNETYRAKHGFKELDVHNSPQRRNRDFKPMLYGDFIGMLNFKLSEPWALTRHLPDLINENHQKPIQWIRYTIKGAIAGFVYGFYQYTGTMLKRDFVDKKLYLSEKRSPFSIRGVWKYAKNFVRPSMNGAALFLGYKLLYDFFEHHTGGQDIPEMLHHWKAWTILTPLVVSYFLPVKHLVWGSITSVLLIFPLYWCAHQLQTGGISEGNRYYFYQDGVEKAERDKFEHMDRIEAIGYARATDHMYGQQREGVYFIGQKYGR